MIIYSASITHATYYSDGTTKALLVDADIFDEQQWIPYKCVHADSEIYKDGETGDITIKDWFAEKKGWSD